MTITDEQLAAIRAREKAVTPGPWAIWRDLDHQGFITVGDAVGVIPDGALESSGKCNPTAHVYVEEDAEFIAHARTDVPALLAEVERLKLAHTTVSVVLDESGSYLRRAMADIERLRGELAEALNQAIYWKGRWESASEATIEQQQRHLARANKHAKQAGEYAVKVGAQRDRMLAAIHIADTDDVTDWQRGYRACAENAQAAYANAHVAPTNSQTWDLDPAREEQQAERLDQQLADIEARVAADRDVIDAAKHFRRFLETATHRGNLDGPAEDAEADFIHAVDAHNALGKATGGIVDSSKLYLVGEDDWIRPAVPSRCGIGSSPPLTDLGAHIALPIKACPDCRRFRMQIENITIAYQCPECYAAEDVHIAPSVVDGQLDTRQEPT